MKKLLWLSLGIFTATLAACGEGGGGGAVAPGGGTAGKNSVVTAVQMAAPIGSCPNGGITVEAGIDTNGNGVLDPAEVTSTQYVCNGANGSNGYTALVAVVTEPSGANCANGGKKVSVGPDANGNSVLDSTEITSGDYICNGTNGANGLSSLVSILAEPAGSNCAGGGLKITSGLDADNDGILDPGEAGTPTYVCNGNTAPIANAGPDQKVAAAGIMVTLVGSGSSDPDGGTPTYSWIFTTRPVGSMAALSSSVVSNPTFTPDKAGKYELSLVVNDGVVSSPADTVTVRAGMPVPDTGQTRWYSIAFGDDGDYTINPMSYTDNGDGTIFDNITGLTWQKCSIGQNNDATCSGTATMHNWYQASGTYDATSNPGTTNVCGSLSLAGSGWRLPTDYELTTIVYFGTYTPAISTAYFPNILSSNYWSSTSYAPSTTYAWVVYFNNGGTYYGNKTSTYYVRCVRG